MTVTIIASLAGCKSEPIVPDIHTPTSLPRGMDGQITVEDLKANEASARAVAGLLLALDRELLEPGRETRSAQEILDTLGTHDLALQSWSLSELPASGARRGPFLEIGIFSVAGKRPTRQAITFKSYVEKTLQAHLQTDAAGQLQAAWRRFSPVVQNRKRTYLASRWDFKLEFPAKVDVSLQDSVLGPFIRTQSDCDKDIHFGTDTASIDGYETTQWLANMLQPAGDSPIAALMKALHGQDNSLRIDCPEASAISEQESKFIASLIRALSSGYCDIGSMPADTKRFDVEFSYLLGTEEARTVLGFYLDQYQWVLDRFDYQPASANLLNNEGVTLDVLPIIATLPGFRLSN